jgi:hypothetical protein
MQTASAHETERIPLTEYFPFREVTPICSQIHLETLKSVQEVSKQAIRRKVPNLRNSLRLKRAGSRVRTDDLLITNSLLQALQCS